MDSTASTLRLLGRASKPAEVPNEKDVYESDDDSINKSDEKPHGVPHRDNLIGDPSRLPPGWTKGKDATGHEVFIDSRGRTQQLDPRTPHGQLVAAYEAQFDEPLPRGWEHKVDTASGKISLVHQRSQRCLTSGLDPRGDVAKVLADYEANATEALPEDWEAKINAAGQIYFSDHKRRRTTWVDPRSVAGKMIEVHEADAKEPLPQGWSLEVSEKGRIYFANHVTKTTSWVDPRGEEFKIVAEHERKFEEPLPEGWEAMVNDRGRVYYADHKTKTTTWDRPSMSSS
jgi:hypothetical protein